MVNEDGHENNNINNLQIDQTSDAKVAPRKKRSVIPTLYSLPDKSSNIELHLKIINAYVVATNEGKKPVSYKDFKNTVDFYYGYISSNNKFLEELGLIVSSETHGMYVPTKQAIDFVRYKKWGQEDKALEILKELVKASWFSQSARQLLLMRETGADEKEILNKLGADSKADPERHMMSLKLLIRYLEYVGFIKRDEKTNKIMMAIELMPMESSSQKEIVSEKQIQNNDTQKTEISGNIERQLPTIQQNPTESTHYREEPGHFTLRVKLDETSISLLEEDIKYIKGKYALLQKSKKGDS